MIIAKVISAFDDLKANDYVIAKNGGLFFQLNAGLLEIHKRGNFAYDLSDKKYAKITKDEADKLIKSSENPAEALKEMEAKLKEVQAENERLHKEADKLENTETKSKK